MGRGASGGGSDCAARKSPRAYPAGAVAVCRARGTLGPGTFSRADAVVAPISGALVVCGARGTVRGAASAVETRGDGTRRVGSGA